MSAKPKVSQRLLRFVESGACKFCEHGKASKYTKELQEVAEEIADVEIADQQSKFFKALADETRLRILRLLELREMCVCEVMVALGLTQPTASHHLGILEKAGLVRDRKEGKWVFYSITNPQLIDKIHKLSAL